MPKNDIARPLEDHSGRKTTSPIEEVGRQASFIAQSSVLYCSVLSTQSLYIGFEN